MHKKLIALAVSGALLTPVLAQAETEVYGQLNLFLGQVTEDTGTPATDADNWQLKNYDSRLGFKGSKDLGEGLALTYQLEYAVDPSDTGAIDAAGRNQYMGLKGGFGEVRFGRHDTPLKMAQGKFDQFGDTDGDLKNAGAEDGENRMGNMLLFMGKSGNIGYNIAVMPGEDAGNAATADTGIADALSASVTYSTDSMYLAVAMDSHENGASAAEDSMTRVVFTTKLGGMDLGVLYQSGVESASPAADKEDWLGLSFAMKTGEKGKIKAQYITTENNAATPVEGTLMALGYDHKLDKNITMYVLHSNVEFTPAADDTTVTGVGLKAKF